MAHGTADWGISSATNTTYALTDLGELAVRLGSIDSYDRRGDVMFMEDFEHGSARYSTLLSGAGAAAAIVATEARSGQNALKLTAGTDATRRAEVYRYFHRPSTTHGVEGHVRIIDPNVTVYIFVHIKSDVTTREFELYYDHAAFTLSLFDGSFGFVTVVSDEIGLPAYAGLFVGFKLVVDVATGRYVRAVVGGVEYDLSAYTGGASHDTTAERLEVHFGVTGVAAATQSIILDDLTVTQNEPV